MTQTYDWTSSSAPLNYQAIGTTFPTSEYATDQYRLVRRVKDETLTPVEWIHREKVDVPVQNFRKGLNSELNPDTRIGKNYEVQPV